MQDIVAVGKDVPIHIVPNHAAPHTHMTTTQTAGELRGAQVGLGGGTKRGDQEGGRGGGNQDREPGGWTRRGDQEGDHEWGNRTGDQDAGPGPGPG